MEQEITYFVHGLSEVVFGVGGEHYGDIVVKQLHDVLVAFGNGAEGHFAAQDFLDSGFANVLVDFLSGDFAFHLNVKSELVADADI